VRNGRDALVRFLTLSLAVLTVTQFALAQADPALSIVSGIAALAIAAALGCRYLAVLGTSRVLGVGHRARAHREVLVAAPAPRHPATRGRRRSRAPSPSMAVT
jgi:hypothetical protein